MRILFFPLANKYSVIYSINLPPLLRRRNKKKEKKSTHRTAAQQLIKKCRMNCQLVFMRILSSFFSLANKYFAVYSVNLPPLLKASKYKKRKKKWTQERSTTEVHTHTHVAMEREKKKREKKRNERSSQANRTTTKLVVYK